jgi:tetratricopeptide (TPR) repeat protein
MEVVGQIRTTLKDNGARVFWLLLAACVVSLVGSRPLLATQAGTGARSATFAPGAVEDGLSQAEAELQTGISLTSHGKFAEAIPHLKAAQGKVRESYAVNFNLALCYVATGQYEPAIRILTGLRSVGHNTANLHDLLAQAYAGTRNAEEALRSLQQAVAIDPGDEKLYLYVEDAATTQRDYQLAIKVLELGLQHLPNSARLHYERGALLSSLDDFDRGRKDFDAARELSPGSTIAYLAAAQASLYEGKIEDAVRTAREGMAAGNNDYMLLAIFGEALIRSGVAPGEAGFREAEAALEKAVAQKPNYSSSQISLGKIYLMEGRVEEAISHLDIGRTLKADDPAVYATLATAYRRQGEQHKAEEMLAILARLNQEQAARIGAAAGDRRSAYGQTRAGQRDGVAAPQP